MFVLSKRICGQRRHDLYYHRQRAQLRCEDFHLVRRCACRPWIVPRRRRAWRKEAAQGWCTCTRTFPSGRAKGERQNDDNITPLAKSRRTSRLNTQASSKVTPPADERLYVRIWVTHPNVLLSCIWFNCWKEKTMFSKCMKPLHKNFKA